MGYVIYVSHSNWYLECKSVFPQALMRVAHHTITSSEEVAQGSIVNYLHNEMKTIN